MNRLANVCWGILLGSFALILLLLPFHAFLSTWGGTAIGPLLVWKSWKEILLVALLPLAVLYLSLKPEIAKTLWSRPVNKLVLLFAAIIGIGALFSPTTFEAIAAGTMFDLRFFALFLVAQILLESQHPWLEKVKKWALPGLLCMAVVLGVLAILQVYGLPKDFLVQFGYNKDASIAPYILVDQNPDALRAFATMRGPNTLGAYLVLPLTMAAALVINQKRNILAWVIIALSSFTLFLTGSRSAWLGALAAIATLIFLSIPAKRLAKMLLWALPAGLALIGLTVWLALAVPAVRLAIFHSSPGDPTLLEGSSEQHWLATTQGIAEVLARPIGYGVGTAGPASFYGPTVSLAENYFVQVAQEVGIVGLAVFLAICIALALQLWRRRQELWPRVLFASFVGLSLINIFLHAWADDPTAMTWWALAGLFAFAKQRKIKA